MEASPLTRQLPPEVFTPKIIQLYDSLFKVSSQLPALCLPLHSLPRLIACLEGIYIPRAAANTIPPTCHVPRLIDSSRK